MALAARLSFGEPEDTCSLRRFNVMSSKPKLKYYPTVKMTLRLRVLQITTHHRKHTNAMYGLIAVF